MRTLIVAILLFVLPQIVHGSTYTPQVNGQAENATKSDATKQVEVTEAGKAPNGKKSLGKTKDTSSIRCPATSQMNASEELAQMSSNNLEECPSEGAIKNHPGDGKGKTIQIK